MYTFLPCKFLAKSRNDSIAFQKLTTVDHEHEAMSRSIGTAVCQASVFIEDAIHYRSIHHKIDTHSLKLYALYHSWPAQLLISITIFTILILAFFEYPTSLTLSSDFRYNESDIFQPLCGRTEVIEFFCLLIFSANWIVQFCLIGRRRFFRQMWLVLYAVMVILSFVDLFASVGFCYHFGRESIWATVRIRRFFRPFFFIVPSSMMKKFIKAVGRTVWQILSVLVLLVLHIYIFAMIGMLLFPPPATHPSEPDNHSNESLASTANYSDFLKHRDFAEEEGRKYFNSVEDSLSSLLIFLTTANNPDVMTPIYQHNRFYFIYFFLFLGIGLYLILNLFTAAIYTEFRGFLEQSMQSSFLRRRVAMKASFTILSRQSGGCMANKDLVREVLKVAKIPHHLLPAMYTELEIVNPNSGQIGWDDFRKVFDLIGQKNGQQKALDEVEYYSRYKVMEWLQRLVRNKCFYWMSILATVAHVLFLTVEMELNYSNIVNHSRSALAYANFFFCIYYTLEQVVKIIGLGRHECRCFTPLKNRTLFSYLRSPGNAFEFGSTLSIVCTELVILILFGSPFGMEPQEPGTYSIFIRVMNLLIVLRLLRIIPLIPSVTVVFGTMVDILKNLRAFAGIIVVIYYFFALLGMEIFGHNEALRNTSYNACDSYEDNEYFAYNFYDFAASLVLLWNIMVVNNWQVFLDAFSRATSKWSQIYFIAWWLVSVIVTVNLFVSLVIEVFLMRWEVYNSVVKKKHRAGDTRAGQFSGAADSMMLASTQSVGEFTNGVNDIRMILRRTLVEPSDSDLMHEIHHHVDLL